MGILHVVYSLVMGLLYGLKTSNSESDMAECECMTSFKHFLAFLTILESLIAEKNLNALILSI